MSLASVVEKSVTNAANILGDLVLSFKVMARTSSLDTATNQVVVTTTEYTFKGVYDEVESGNMAGSTAVKEEQVILIMKTEGADLSVIKSNSEIQDQNGTLLSILKTEPIYAGNELVLVKLMVTS